MAIEARVTDDGVVIIDFGDIDVLFDTHIHESRKLRRKFYDKAGVKQKFLLHLPNLRLLNAAFDEKLSDEAVLVTKKLAWVCPLGPAHFTGVERIKLLARNTFEVRGFQYQSEALQWLGSAD